MGGGRGRHIGLDDRQQAITLIDDACANGARKRLACGLLGITVRTYQRWQKDLGLIDKRSLVKHSPKNKLTPTEHAEVIEIATSTKYCDLPPCKIVPTLADKGLYIASESTFYRILAEEKLLAHRSSGRPAKHKKPTIHIARAPNRVWSWDITYCPSNVLGLYYFLYLIIDIYSRKIVGWTAEDVQSDKYAALLIDESCQIENVSKGDLVLHADNGGPMKGATMLAKLETLGVLPSFSRPRVSDDNAFSESVFRTMKYRPDFPFKKHFSSLLDLRIWVNQFVHWYNTEHMHSGLKFVTPQQRHTGEDKEILAKRKEVYELAKKRMPERWSGNTRNWILADYVSLHPCDIELLEALSKQG